ncbi:unnamed protein product, partial [Mesorhabditis belari]|uniref:HMG box domain-containing protein n=1 Tax=Mesorhabditis belari TaxID=2138241 RepID=A0AAF3EMM5_9BILA
MRTRPSEPSTYRLWLTENRPRLTRPGISATEVSKATGAEWKNVTDRSKKQMARPTKGSSSQEVSKVSQKNGGSPPKRNLTAFFIWLAENRARLIETVKPNKVLKAAGAEWKKLENKSVWEEKAKADKERYRKELEAFKGRSTI